MAQTKEQAARMKINLEVFKDVLGHRGATRSVLVRLGESWLLKLQEEVAGALEKIEVDERESRAKRQAAEATRLEIAALLNEKGLTVADIYGKEAAKDISLPRKYNIQGLEITCRTTGETHAYRGSGRMVPEFKALFNEATKRGYTKEDMRAGADFKWPPYENPITQAAALLNEQDAPVQPEGEVKKPAKRKKAASTAAKKKAAA
jgi:hypothetical protein